MEKLSIFLTWSGDTSEAVAKALHDWLPSVLQFVEPWISISDIEKGSKWRQDLSGQLARANFGIVCLTPDNLNSPWLLFEAGALSKSTDARVWTYLYKLADTEVKDPLSQFQHTLANKEDTKKLVSSINQLSGEHLLQEGRLNSSFEKWWPDLETCLESIPPPATEGLKAPPTERILDMTSEILTRVREMNKLARKRPSLAVPPSPSTAQQRKQYESLVRSIQTWRGRIRSE